MSEVSVEVVRRAEAQLAEPVLVTGAAGFIGRHLVRRLRRAGKAVLAFDLPGTLGPLEAEGAVAVPGDVTDAAAVARAVGQARTVIHLAAIIGDWGEAQHFWNVNVEGSRHVYQAALDSGARVVLASSIVIYGEQIARRVCTEDLAPGRFFGPYGRCKQAQEALAWDYHRRGLLLSVVRPANVYGPGSRPWVDGVVEVLRAGLPSLIGGGRFNAGLACVENVVDMLLLAGSMPQALGRAYHAADDSGVTWAQYFTDLARLVGAPRPRPIPLALARLVAPLLEGAWRGLRLKTRPPLTREAVNLVGAANRISMQRARDELGYSPRVSYAEGLREVARYLQTGALFVD